MIHKVQCPSCGLCYRECFLQANAIRQVPGGVEIDLDKCNRCGHCSAICPHGFMDNPLLPPQQEAGEPFSPEEAERFLRFPRSIRHYRPALVPREKLEALLNAGRFPQTPENSQGISYLVVRGRDRVEQLNRLYCRIAEALPEDHPEKQMLMKPVRNQQREGRDALFYGCPQVIFALCGRDDARGDKNALFSLLFIALMAPSLGLGTCWSGQTEKLACRQPYGEQFARLLELPPDKRLCGCMMVGYPAVRFRRLTARDPLQVQWRDDENDAADRT